MPIRRHTSDITWLRKFAARSECKYLGQPKRENNPSTKAAATVVADMSGNAKSTTETGKMVTTHQQVLVTTCSGGQAGEEVNGNRFLHGSVTLSSPIEAHGCGIGELRELHRSQLRQ